MSALWQFVIGIAVLVSGTVIADMASDEVHTRLDRLPIAAVRFIARRMPPSVQAELEDEWTSDLHELLHDTAKLPLTRLWRSARFTVGLVQASPQVARMLSGLRTTPHQLPKPMNSTASASRARKTRVYVTAPFAIITGTTATLLAANSSGEWLFAWFFGILTGLLLIALVLMIAMDLSILRTDRAAASRRIDT